MNLLVLGGTLFLGRHVVEAALARGHRVTTLTRGRTNPHLVPAVESLRGDRNGDLGALGGRTWDAVVDTSGYLPQQVAASASMLSRSARYCLISTGSVYAGFPAGGADENASTLPALYDSSAAVRPDTYGPLKVACEQAVLAAFGDRSLVVRPGVLAGPHDPTGRFGYWVDRVAEGGDVLAPGDPMHAVQLLDARDLAAWLITLLEHGESGIFNASGPTVPLTMGGLLETCRAAAASDAHFTWASDDFLLAEGVVPWVDLPLWLPSDVPGPILDSRKAWGAGLRPRSVVDTARDVLACGGRIEEAAGGPPRPAAMSRARERALLHLFRTRARDTTS